MTTRARPTTNISPPTAKERKKPLSPYARTDNDRMTVIMTKITDPEIMKRTRLNASLRRLLVVNGASAFHPGGFEQFPMPHITETYLGSTGLNLARESFRYHMNFTSGSVNHFV
jgi:hypothetical protein